MQVNRYLCPQRLGKNEFVSHLGKVRLDVLTIITHGIGNSSNDGPRVEYSLASSDESLGLDAAVVKSFDHLAGDDFPLGFGHLQTHS